MFNLLIVEDDFCDQNVIRTILPDFYSVTMCSSGSRAIDLMKSRDYQAVLLDIVLPDLDGFSVLEAMKNITNPPPVIVVSGQSDSGSASRAFRFGAHDYIEKPYTIPELLDTLSNAVGKGIRTQQAALTRQEKIDENPILSHFIGNSDAIRTVKGRILSFAPSELPVLITGESGTGKELTARAIHSLSTYREGPMIPVNCGAVPEALSEAEFFGSEKGAYTDAVSRAGIFERADGGTIFLDEIGEMSLQMQVKLLRVLEQKELLRVGGAVPRRFRARVVSATNRDIREAASQGKFRQDLFYRIGVLHIVLPPLRERKIDIPIIAEHLIAISCKQMVPARTCPELTRPALWKLKEYNWPGNIRELKNVLERALLLCTGSSIGPEMIEFQ